MGLSSGEQGGHIMRVSSVMQMDTRKASSGRFSSMKGGIVVHENQVAEANQWKVIKPWGQMLIYDWLVSLTPSRPRNVPISSSPIIPA